MDSHRPYICSVFFSFKIFPFFPFYAEESYTGCDGIEFLFTVLSTPSTATFLPTARTTSCPNSLSLIFSFSIFLFFLFMQRKFTLDATELDFFLQCCPLRGQRHFHQQLRRRCALIRYVCSSPFKFPFFPFYAEEIYAGCDGTEFLFTVLSPPSTATFPPTAQTAAPIFLRLFSATRHTCRRFVWTLARWS